MRKFNRVSTLLLISKKQPTITKKILSLTFSLSTFFWLIGWHQLLTQNTSAQTLTARQQLSWQVLFEENKPPVPKKPGIDRNPARPIESSKLCAIAPEPAPQEIWSDRPLFVWQAEVGKIEVRSPGRKNALWQQPVTAAQRSVLYGGDEALQPGEIYNWVSFDRQNKRLFVVRFKVMDAEKRDRIKTQLQSLEAELKAKGATGEEIAMHRAQYFAQQKLWSDFWQEVFSVENPSTALTEMVKTQTTQLCLQASEQNS